MCKELTTDIFIKRSVDKHGDLYKRTIEREKYLETLGYKIVSIWESDFKKILIR